MTKILLVEDDKSLREIYGVRLLAEGYDIVSAGDGEEALAMAIKEKPHLIISDVMMPKISGFDMLDILRSTTETRDIKVIMMTALSSEDQRSRGEQLGADKYLVKSQVGIEDVVHTVHEVLGDSSKGEPTNSAEGNKESTESAPAEAENTVAVETPPVEEAPTEQAPVEEAPVEQAPVVEPVPVQTPEVPTAPVVEEAPTVDSTPELVVPEPTGEAQQSTLTIEPLDQTLTSSIPSVAAPGNEDAGPLPPQPSEIESALPQPTAPFSSPAPHSLGEQITQPEAPVADPSPEVLDPSVNAVENESLSFEQPVQPPVGDSLSSTVSEPVPVTSPEVVDNPDQVTPGTTPPAATSTPAI